MSRKYFGTDGIRGRVGVFPVVPEFAMKLGYAVGKVLGTKDKSVALIGQDTRRSGFMLSSAMSAGFSAAGVDVINVGVMPTPAIAYLTRKYGAQLGVVISASHNPFYDNGIKLFSDGGEKLPDDVELEIERLIDSDTVLAPSEKVGSYHDKDDAIDLYAQFCINALGQVGLDLSGIKVVVDCAQGAMYKVAPKVLQSFGAEIIQIFASPNGMNINEGCGAVHTEKLQQAVLDNRADVGIAFDGDGDRLMMVDKTGTVVDGDAILYVIANQSKLKGDFSGGVVGTVMTNLGVEMAFNRCDIPFARAKVGDRYVFEIMKQKKWVLGGEASGHVICYDVNTTGDGLIAALRVLRAVQSSGKDLHEILSEVIKVPQCMINVPLSRKANDADLAALQCDVEAVEERLLDKGRVVLRPSGTEPVLRVMVEAVDGLIAKQEAEYLVNCVKDKIN